MFKLYFKKAEEPEIKLPTLVGSQKNKGIPEKKLKSTSALLTMLKLLTVWITKKKKKPVENS